MMIDKKVYVSPLLNTIVIKDVIMLSGGYVIVEPISDGGTYIK